LEECFFRFRFSLDALFTFFQQLLGGITVVNQTGIGVSIEDVISNQPITYWTTLTVATRQRRKDRIEFEEFCGRLFRRTLLGNEFVDPSLTSIGFIGTNG
jgi:hypothetical protein